MGTNSVATAATNTSGDKGGGWIDGYWLGVVSHLGPYFHND